MKKYIITLSLSLLLKYGLAQNAITDTTKYLYDSIELNKANFLNKSFGNLITNLKLGIKYYSVGAPLPSQPDTLIVKRIVLFFNSIREIVIRDVQNKNNPYIEVLFLNPILIPKHYLESGGILDWDTDWNTIKAKFFSKEVITSIKVNGQ